MSADAIRALNDAARQTLTGCKVVITPGVDALDYLSLVLIRVRLFNDFNEDNDPHGEHDFGIFKHRGETLYWKFDYYDNTLERGSKDPSDPAITTRVLTIMTSGEY